MNFLRKQKKGYTSTFSDDESDEESESEQANNVVSFIAHVRSKPIVYSDEESSDEDVSNDALAKAYKLLYLKLNEECRTCEKQRNKINVLLQEKSHLTSKIYNLKEKVDHLNSKLEGMIKSVHILNFGYETFDEFLGVGK